MVDTLAPPHVEAQPKEAPKTGGLFGSTSKQPLAQNQMQEIVLQLNDVSRRLIILEERYGNLRKKTQLTDQNMLENQKEYNKQLSGMRDLLSQFQHELTDIHDKMKVLAQELSTCAKQQDVEVLKKYIDVWNPVGFVTRNEVFRLIKDQVETTMMDLNMKIQQEAYIKRQVEEQVKKFKQ